MSAEQEQINISKWIGLDGNFGLNFTIADKFIIGYQNQHLSIWENRNLILEQRLAIHAPGFPILSNGKVYAGFGEIDVQSKEYNIDKDKESIFNAGLDIEAQDIYFGNYLPVCYAWSPNAEEVLVSIEWKGKPKAPLSRVLLLDNKAGLKKVIYQGNTPPSKALVFTKDAIVTGSKTLKIYDREGNCKKEFKSDMLIRRLEVVSSQDILLSVSANEMVVWDTKNWNPVGKLAGSWLDASISPKGNVVAAVDSVGRLFLIPFNNKFGLPQKIGMKDGVTSLSLSENEIVALFTSGIPVRVAEITLPQ